MIFIDGKPGKGFSAGLKLSTVKKLNKMKKDKGSKTWDELFEWMIGQIETKDMP